MGVRIKSKEQATSATSAKGIDVTVDGVGMHGLRKPHSPLYLGNSGTTMRILPGILAGQDFEVVLKGDKSLSSRPMRRIVEPLREMGISILATSEKQQGTREVYPPLRIKGGRVKTIEYKSKIASAQVKSCILMAGLFAEGVTSVTEPVKSRDHTERMLAQFGCKVQRRECRVSVRGPVKLKSSGIIEIPGDISSAAFFIVASSILPDTEIIIKNVGLNPTRTGIIDILKKMSANLTILTRLELSGCEPKGDIIVKTSRLKGITISPEEVVAAIDEIPIVMVAACFAKGTTIIQGIGELRVKETDRIKSMVTNLCKMGADIEVKGEWLKVRGRRALHGVRVSSFGDHRTAMSMLVAGLLAGVKVTVTGLDCIKKSFPGFESFLRKNFPFQQC
jgi:3-phosphoshikimate 1-carboxyvinyltransferase